MLHKYKFGLEFAILVNNIDTNSEYMEMILNIYLLIVLMFYINILTIYVHKNWSFWWSNGWCCMYLQ